MWAGSVIADVKLKTPVKAFTVRATEFAAAEAGGTGAEVKAFQAPADVASVAHPVRLLQRGEERPARADRGQHRRLRRPRDQGRLQGDRGARRRARRGGGRLPRGVRRRLGAERLPGRPDRQGRRPEAVHRRRHLGCHPAPRGDEGQQDHRGHQQGPRGAHLPGRRLRDRGRPLQGPPRAPRGDSRSRSDDRPRPPGRRRGPPRPRNPPPVDAGAVRRCGRAGQRLRHRGPAGRAGLLRHRDRHGRGRRGAAGGRELGRARPPPLHTPHRQPRPRGPLRQRPAPLRAERCASPRAPRGHGEGGGRGRLGDPGPHVHRVPPPAGRAGGAAAAAGRDRSAQR